VLALQRLAPRCPRLPVPVLLVFKLCCARFPTIVDLGPLHALTPDSRSFTSDDRGGYLGCT
jgi:hypothetical protein